MIQVIFERFDNPSLSCRTSLNSLKISLVSHDRILDIQISIEFEILFDLNILQCRCRNISFTFHFPRDTLKLCLKVKFI